MQLFSLYITSIKLNLVAKFIKRITLYFLNYTAFSFLYLAVLCFPLETLTEMIKKMRNYCETRIRLILFHSMCQ